MIHRRSIIKSAAASVVLAPIASAFSSSSQDDSSWIDAHVHVWTPDVEKYPLSPRFKVSDMLPASFTPEQLFVYSKPAGVSKIVLVQMNFYEFDNSYMLDCIKQHPGIFGGIAIVDENSADAAETMKSMHEQGVRGYRLYSDKESASRWQKSEAMCAMWERALKLGQSMCLLANPDALPMIFEMCERYPENRVVIDHFARIGVTGQIIDRDVDALCRLAKFKNTYVKTSAFYALGQKQAPYEDLGPMIRRMLDAFGPERLMWASDCPYQVEKGHTYQDSIALVRDRLSFLSESDKRWMLRGTAERVFFDGK